MKRVFYFLLFLFVLVTSPVVADECMEGNCEDGVGVGFTDEGKIYQGHWQHGLPHGNGKLQISRGKYVEGLWEKGVLKEEKKK